MTGVPTSPDPPLSSLPVLGSNGQTRLETLYLSGNLRVQVEKMASILGAKDHFQIHTNPLSDTETSKKIISCKFHEGGSFQNLVS